MQSSSYSAAIPGHDYSSETSEISTPTSSEEENCAGHSVHQGNHRIVLDSGIPEQLQDLRLDEPSRSGGAVTSSRAGSELPPRPVDDEIAAEDSHTITPGRPTSPRLDTFVFELGNERRNTSPSLPDSSFDRPTSFEFAPRSPMSFGSTPESRVSPSPSPRSSHPSISGPRHSLAPTRPIRQCRSRSVTPTSLQQIQRRHYPHSYSTPAIPVVQTPDSSATPSSSSTTITGSEDPSLLGTISSPNLEHLTLEDGPLYEIRDEPPPSEPFFNEAFQEALELGRGLVRDLSASLSYCDLAHTPESDIGRIWRTAQKLERFDRPETRTIGIVGDSGSGKSSLINSLLHVKELAHKADHGDAVTSFVTEYRRREPRHVATYTIEAEYSTETEIGDQLQELLYDYRALFNVKQSNKSSATNSEFSEYEEAKRKSDSALATLQDIFPGAEEVRPERLQQQPSAAGDHVFDALKALARQIKWPENAKNGKWCSTAEDPKECHAKVSLFMEGGLWPLTNVVRIYVDALVLESGVILADLPGFRDVNRAREKRAEQYLLNCDEVFVVAPIVRITSNLSVKFFIQQYSKRRASRKFRDVSVICTHAEEINLIAAERKYSEVAGEPETVVAKRNFQNNRRHGSDVHQHELAKTIYQNIYMRARNADLVDKMISRYPQLRGPDGIAKVFCVANKAYEGEEFVNRSAHFEAIKGSGIPELRRFCRSVVARAQFQACDYFLQFDVPNLVQSLQTWLDAYILTPHPPSLSHVIDPIQQEFEKTVELYLGKVHRLIRRQMWEPVNGRHELQLNTEASQVSDQWKGFAYNSYKAFARKNGVHAVSGGDEQDWNAEILSVMFPDQDERWDILEGRISHFQEELKDTFRIQLTELRLQMRYNDASQDILHAIAMKQKSANIAGSALDRSLAETLRTYSTIRDNATHSFSCSFVLETMIPTYRNIFAQHGPGCKRRMLAIMDKKMQERSIFPHIRDRTCEELGEALEINVEQIRTEVISWFTDLRALIETQRGPESEAARCTDDERGQIARVLRGAPAVEILIQHKAQSARDDARRRGLCNAE